MRTRFFNLQMRMAFLVRMAAEEDDAQIETWMIGSGNEPTSNSLRCDNASAPLWHDVTTILRRVADIARSTSSLRHHCRRLAPSA
jgi:hypothetical protein